MGPEVLVPLLCAYGMPPRFLTPTFQLPYQEERMRALEAAQREMETIIAQFCIQQALRSTSNFASCYLLNPGDHA